MKIIPIQTERVELNPEGTLSSWIIDQLYEKNQALVDGDILVVTSKVVSFFEGKVVPMGIQSLEEIVESEADEILHPSEWVMLTRKNDILCPNAGVDTSNAPEGHVVLWPTDAFASAYKLQREISEQENLSKLAVIIADCVCQPGRSGTTAIAIGYAGIKGFDDLKDSTDLFGNTLRYSALNIVDSLATSANLLMGEGRESQPLAIIREYDWELVEQTKNDEMNISSSDEMFPLS